MDKQWADLMQSNVQDLKSDVRSIDKKLDKLTTDHAVHKVKSGFWGAIGGLLINIINLFR